MSNRNFEFDQPEADAIRIWPGEQPHHAEDDGYYAFINPYLVETDKPRGCVIVNPGGGYSCRVDYESSPVARRFNDFGIHGFTCQYRIPPHRYPAAYCDISRTIQIIRHNAKQWNVDPNRIAVLGFSAGGHLSATIGVHNHPGDPHSADPIEHNSTRPDALVLCYPAISATHDEVIRASFKNLLGDQTSDELLEHLSTEKHVTKDTPPAFIWHTANDEVVNVEHPLMFADALSRHKVPFELHVYANGKHGLGLAENDDHVKSWSQLAGEWLLSMGW